MISTGLKKNTKIESVILSHPVQVINWTSNVNCVPCKNQERDLSEIERTVDDRLVGIVSLPFQSYRKEFSKLGNKVLPSINIFVQGTQMSFLDTKLHLAGQKGYKNKPVKSLAGARSKKDLKHVVDAAEDKL